MNPSTVVIWNHWGIYLVCYCIVNTFSNYQILHNINLWTMNTIRSWHHHGADTWQNVSLSEHFSGRKAETKYRSASTEEQPGKSGVLPRAARPEGRQRTKPKPPPSLCLPTGICLVLTLFPQVDSKVRNTSYWTSAPLSVPSIQYAPVTVTTANLTGPRTT